VSESANAPAHGSAMRVIGSQNRIPWHPLLSWFSSGLVVRKRTPRGPKRLDLQHSGHRRRGKHCRRDARGWKPPSWQPAQRANGPGAMPRPVRRFATFHGLSGLDEAVLAMPATTTTDSRSPLRASANNAGVVVASGKQRVYVPVVAFSESSKPAGDISKSCGLGILKRPPDQATVPTSLGAPRPPQPNQLFGRRTKYHGTEFCLTFLCQTWYSAASS